MMGITQILYADIYRITKNKIVLLTLFIPQLLVLLLSYLQFENTISAAATGYDIWVIYSKDILMVLSFVLPLFAIVYPFVILENEHRHNGLRTHSILPLKMGNYFVSKLLLIWMFLVYTTIFSSLLLLIIGYIIGALFGIKEFVLYSPTIIGGFTVGILLISLFVSSVHLVLNIFFKNFLINTLPFLLILFPSFFLYNWKYYFLNIYSYPFRLMNSLQLDYVIINDLTSIICFIGLMLSLIIIRYLIPKCQYIWIN
ncbi:hypothetical protein SPPR111872_14915 [Sphingobacterium prati]